MHRFLTCTLCFLFVAAIGANSSADDKLKALIIDGQNNHAAWPKTTIMMKKYLEDTGRFTVDVERTKYTWKGGDLLTQFPLDDGKTYEDLKEPKSDPNFKPQFFNYDVVINNFGWRASAWPAETQKSFEQYVRGGGGLVIIHAADNSFGDWNAYNQMIGLGGWGGRDEKSGPYVYVDESGETVRDKTPGKGGAHGPQHPFQIIVRNPDHPITKGLPRSWMHTKDELYQELRGPANNMTILATTYADPEFKGTGRHEPMMMTIEFDKGRVYHTPMGHADEAMECVGFITTLIRGTEWAATGEVTLTEVPGDFPTANEISVRDFD